MTGDGSGNARTESRKIMIPRLFLGIGAGLLDNFG
jgi:hypothetical protein